MGTPAEAMRQTREALEASVLHRTIDRPALARFEQHFRKDFEDVLAKNPEAWKNDWIRVTTLARAIGSLAKFLSIAAEPQGTTVSFSHLEAAYRILKPSCNDGPKGGLRREYCTSYQP